MNIAVVDDNTEDRRLLEKYIKNISRELNYEMEVTTHSLGENFLEDEDLFVLDAVFLDIYMGVKNGMEVAKTLRDKGYSGFIIFCTSTADFALEGYSVNAMGYIVKPFAYSTIVKQMKHIFKLLGEKTRYICVKDGRQWYKVNISDILYIEKQGNYVQVHAFNKIYSIRMALAEIEKDLCRHNCFVKCDRGIIVSLQNIKEIYDNIILLKNGDRIPISRSNKLAVNNRYFDFIFEKME